MTTVYSGCLSSGIITSGDLNVYGGVVDTTVNSGGSMYVSSGGTANSTTINSAGHMTVSYGGTANYTTVNSGASMAITYSGTANNTIVSTSGRMFIYTVGRANSTTVNSGDSMVIGSGGRANETTVNSSGALVVSGSGTANSTTVNSSGGLFVDSGGTANFTTVNSGGLIRVSSGGTATKIIAVKGARLQIAVAPNTYIEGASAGSAFEMTLANISGYTVNSGGDLAVSSGGTANSTTVNSGGSLRISSGGTATEIVENGGYVNIASGASATFVKNSFSGLVIDRQATVHSGTTANCTTINTWGSMTISSGGRAIDTTVNSGGSLSISSGGTANGIVENGGYVDIASGASATFAKNSFSGLVIDRQATVHSGTTANCTTVGSLGGLHIFDGGRTNSIAVNSSGWLYIFDGGRADSTAVNSRGVLRIFSGGRADFTTVNSHGKMIISSGGTATGIVENGGYVGIETGASATFAQNSFSGLVVNSATVHSGTTANNTTIRALGSLCVYSGGTANSTTICSGGTMFVSDGGAAYGVIVSAGGQIGGFSWNTDRHFNFIGIGSVQIAEPVTIIGNQMTVHSGGSENATIVNTSAWMYIANGGTATNIVENGGGVYMGEGATVTFAPNSFSGLLLSNGATATIHSGTTANSTRVNSGGHMIISSGGTAVNIVAVSGARLSLVVAPDTYVQGTCNGSTFSTSNATISAFTIEDQAFMSISCGGIANSTTLKGIAASMTVFSGGTANSTKVNGRWARMVISRGGTANFTTIIGLYTHMTIFAGGTANYASVNSNGNMAVSSGGTANGTMVNSNGNMIIFYGGAANDTIVNADGHLSISSGGTASNTNVNGKAVSSSFTTAHGYLTSYTYQRGFMDIVSGGTANATIINEHGNLTIFSGGTANSTVIKSNGSMTVSSGGTAVNIVAENGAKLCITVCPDAYIQGTSCGRAFEMTEAKIIGFTLDSGGGTMSISSGGTATSTTVNSRCYVTISSGGTATSTTVNTWGFMTISSGGTATSTTVNSGGCMTISSGGMATGQMSFESGATISAYTGSIIDFDISGVATGDDALANNLSLVQGTPDFTITVSANQAVGKYILADGAASFNKTVTVRLADSTELGTIYVGGQLAADERTYALAKQDNRLFLTVGGGTLPEVLSVTPNTTAPTNQNVTVTATFSADSAQKQYSLNNSTWNTYTTGVVMADNGTVYFRGIDAAGNISEVVSYAVTNIDKVAPNKPTVSASTTAPTNGNVTVTATFSEDSVVREYSLDGETWQDYDEGGVITIINGTVYFRGIDAAGNISDVTEYAVTNIDRTPPAQPTANADITAPTNGNVTVSAIFSGDSAQKQYSLDGANWSFYTQPVVMADNGTVYFRGIDSVGNVSGVTAYAVTNIYHGMPECPIDIAVGGFSGGLPQVLKHGPDGTLAIFNTQTGASTPVGNLDRAKWAIKGAGDYSHTGTTEVLMQNLQTGDVRLVANAAAGVTEESVEQSLRLGIVSGG